MSKAFTRESDDAPEMPVAPRPSTLLPPGVKNYLTRDGAERLRQEIERLSHSERPKVASLTEGDDARRQLLALDQQIAGLRQILGSAEIVPPPAPPWQIVRFGASVTVRRRDGSEERYRLVGVDETDVDRGWVSWRSPIARALLNARTGQRVRFRFPDGEEDLEILAVTYE